CALRFELQPSESIPWLRLDEIKVIVHDYLPPPLLMKQVDVTSKLGVEKPHLYYVEIDDPAIVGEATFVARYCSEKGVGDPLRFVRLNGAKPEGFACRINARRPGTYTFSVALLLSYRDRTMTHTVTERAAYYFFKRKGSGAKERE